MAQSYLGEVMEDEHDLQVPPVRQTNPPCVCGFVNSLSRGSSSTPELWDFISNHPSQQTAERSYLW